MNKNKSENKNQNHSNKIIYPFILVFFSLMLASVVMAASHQKDVAEQAKKTADEYVEETQRDQKDKESVDGYIKENLTDNSSADSDPIDKELEVEEQVKPASVSGAEVKGEKVAKEAEKAKGRKSKKKRKKGKKH